MVVQSFRFRSTGSKSRLLGRIRKPRIEICEQRTLLASTGFLQGVVTLNGTSQGQAGAIVQLYNLNSPTTPIQTITTGASGVYLFQNLPSGNYKITETPPAGYVNNGVPSQSESPLTPISGPTSSSIDVQLSDPSQLLVSYPSRNKEILTVSATPPINPATGLVGQMNITVNEPDISYTTSLLPSFCVDLYRDIHSGDTNLPYSLEPLSTALASDSNVKNPQNAGEIAYLYNKIGSLWSTNSSSYVPVAEAAGLQLAIWELEYETSGTYNILNGSFLAQGLTTSSAEYTYAQNFLSEAQGHNELAAYLNGLPPNNGANGSQGLIVLESLNFSNLPQGTVNTTIMDATTNSPLPAGGEALGTTVYDTATVTAAPSTPVPTGTVTYNFYNTASPNYGVTTPISTQTVTLTSTGAVPNSTTTTALSAGSYSYIAVYTGDTNYAGSVGSVEPLTVNQAASTVSTTIHDSGGGSVTGDLGETVYDTATVTGSPFTPTGTLTYNFYNTLTPVYGTTTPSSTQTVTLTGTGAVPNSTTTTALSAGSYSYIAVYSGDTNYKGSVGTVEPLTVNQGSSSVSTTIHDSGGGTVTGALGETVYDTATVTGSPFTPTGTLTYNFYNTLTPVYGTTTPSSTQTVTLTGTGAVPNSTTTTALSAGSYSYIAVYSGDTNYKGSVGTVEPLTVNQGSSSVSTTIHDSGGGTVTGALGETVYDTATVTGSPFTPTGTLTYNFYNTLTPVYGTTTPSSTQTVTLTGTGAVPNSTTTTALSAGSYSYIAVYSGDTNYKGSVGTVEPLTVNQGSSSVSTTIHDSGGGPVTGDQNEKVYDTATVAGTPLTPTGTLTYNFYTTLTPIYGSTTPSSTQTVTLTSTGTVPNSATTPALQAGDYSYIAVYTGDTNYKGSIGAAEPLLITNGHPTLPTGIDGTVFCDCNNDGIQQPGETGISGVTLTLTGVDLNGHSVNLVTTTSSQGTYEFGSLQPGTYTITESAPSGYFEGKNTAGTAGGTVTGDVISGITLAAGITASEYNFANITPSTISGVVYYDVNQNGVLDSHDFGIAHVTITLDGTNDLGQSVQMTTVTNNNGDYSFGDLRPGTYDLIRTQPSIFQNSKNAAGSLGGTVSKNAISDIPIPGCATAVDYYFGENQRPTCNLHNLALHVGNLFYHFERAYHNDPAAFAQHYPNLVASVAAGQVPWGKAPFPKAPLATYWVPAVGTKPLKIFPVHGKLKRYPTIASTPTSVTIPKLAKTHAASPKTVTVHTPSTQTKLVRKILR